MELALHGCTGDVREVLVLRRRTGAGLDLLLLCWLLAHPAAHGKWRKNEMRGSCFHPTACVRARFLLLLHIERGLTRCCVSLLLVRCKSRLLPGLNGVYSGIRLGLQGLAWFKLISLGFRRFK